MSFGALMSQTKFQHNSSTPSWYKFEIEFTIRITIRNVPKNRISFEKALFYGPSVNMRPFFKSNKTKVSVIKVSQN